MIRAILITRCGCTRTLQMVEKNPPREYIVALSAKLTPWNPQNVPQETTLRRFIFKGYLKGETAIYEEEETNETIQ